MQLDDCFELGYLTRTKGLRGELQAFLDVDDPSYYQNLDSILISIDHELVPFAVEHITIQGAIGVLKLEGIDHIDQASELKSHKLHLPLTSLPQLKPHQFYFHDLVNYTIVDQKIGELGTISRIYNLPNNDLFAIEYQGKEVLIPIHNDLIQRVDKDKETVTVSIPDGLLDIYLES